jgi:hypothetical protein
MTCVGRSVGDREGRPERTNGEQQRYLSGERRRHGENKHYHTGAKFRGDMDVLLRDAAAAD